MQIKWIKEEVVDGRLLFSCHVEDKKIKVEIINDKFISKDWNIIFYKVDDDTYCKEWKMPKYKIITKIGAIKNEKEVVNYLQKLVEEHLRLCNYNLNNIPEEIL